MLRGCLVATRGPRLVRWPGTRYTAVCRYMRSHVPYGLRTVTASDWYISYCEGYGVTPSRIGIAHAGDACSVWLLELSYLERRRAFRRWARQ